MNNFETKVFDQKNRNERNAYWISLMTGIILIMISIISLIATIQTKLFSFSGVFLTATVSISAFISAYLSKKNRPRVGILILILTILVVSLSLPTIAKGQGLLMGVMVVILVSGIALTTLDPQWSVRATLTAITVGIIIILIDLVTPIGFGTPTDPRFTQPVALILTIIYSIFLAIRFPSFNLQAKFIISFIAVSIIPLAIMGYQNYQNISNSLSTETNRGLLNSASLIADKLDGFIESQLDSLRTEALIADFSDYLSIPPTERSGKREETRVKRTLQVLQQKDPIHILSYALLDMIGIAVVDTEAEAIGSNRADQDYFKEAITGVPFASTVRISMPSGKSGIIFSAPVRNNEGTILGVLSVRYSATILQAMLSESLQSNTSQQYAVLIDNQYQIQLAHTWEPTKNFTSFGNLTQSVAEKLQGEGRLISGIFTDVVKPLPASIYAINNIDNKPNFSAPSNIPGLGDSISAGARLKNQQDWIIQVSEPANIAMAPINNQTRSSILLSLLMAALVIGAAIIVASILNAPITSLTNVAEKVLDGDYTVQAEIKSQDEIGVLTQTFNKMTSQIRQTLQGLELRVHERTEDLQKAKEQSEKRALAFEAISEISRVIATEQDPDQLLPLITRMISQRFNFYHAGIFLLDDSGIYAVLRAANSSGGQRMLARGHKLEVGLTGLVGFVSQKGSYRIALDVGEDAVFFNNPDLSETRSEIALPLNLRGKTIGVLDVQSTIPSAFSEADAVTLTILAEQVAIAIDNARLISETQRALSETQTLYRQFISQNWEKTSRSGNSIGYLQSLSGGKALDTAINTPEIMQAVSTGEIVIIENQQNENIPRIAVPIKLRDQVIGVLNVRSSEKDHNWNQDEIGILQAVSERVGYALDNARLLDDLQRRAARERSIGEISTRISEANDIDAILRSTVEELGKKLLNAEVAIQINDQSGDQR